MSTRLTIGLRRELYGALCGAVSGQLVAVLVLLQNPVFFDHLGWTLVFLGAVPGALGLLLVLVYTLVVRRRKRQREWAPSRRERKILTLVVASLAASCLTIWQVSRSAVRRPLGPTWPELLVVGLDGATWDIIDPMIEAGGLPTLAELCQTGARGTLETLSPIWSPVIWTSIETGREPDGHGITGYYKTRSDLKCARLWDVAHDHGKRVGLFQWLVTWPPDTRFGFVIPSWLARSPETWPPEYRFIQELNLSRDETGDCPSPGILWAGVLHGFRNATTVHLASSRIWASSDTDDAFIEQQMRSVEPSADVFLHLLRRYQPNVTCMCLYGTDQLAHRFWKYFDPEPFGDVDADLRIRYGHVIPDYYRLADRALGRILGLLSGTTVLVVSDHGMGPDLASPARYVFRMERILQKAGLDGRFTVTFVQRRYILRPLAHLTPQELKSAQATLERIHLHENTEPIFEVETEEDGTITLNPRMEMVVEPSAPLQNTQGIVINEAVLRPNEAIEVRHLSGKHESKGILILKGPAIRRGTETKDATVLDIAPTALALLGLPVSREMSGRILDEVFQEDFLAQHPVEMVDSFPPPPPIAREKASDAGIAERLRALGYAE